MVTGGITTRCNELAPLELTYEEIEVAVQEAHRRGRKVVIHAHGRTGIEMGLKAGVDSIEHAIMMDEELAKIAAAQGTYVVPTFCAHYFAVQEGLKQNKMSSSFEKSRGVTDIQRKNIFHVYKQGVKIALGTDAGTPFNTIETIHQELRIMADIGIPAIEVLKMSTYNSADLMDLVDLGSIDVGKKATFVIFDQDPTVDINNLDSISAVYQNGIKVL